MRPGVNRHELQLAIRAVIISISTPTLPVSSSTTSPSALSPLNYHRIRYSMRSMQHVSYNRPSLALLDSLAFILTAGTSAWLLQLMSTPLSSLSVTAHQ